MRPCAERSDRTDLRLRDTESASYFFLSPLRVSNSHDLGFRQFRGWISHSFGVSGPVASFGDHVSYVIRRGSDEEMFWVDAASDVAPMKNMRGIGRNGAIGQDPSDTMSLNLFSVYTDSSVSVSSNVAFPEPTVIIVRDTYVSPETEPEICLSAAHPSGTTRGTVDVPCVRANERLGASSATFDRLDFSHVTSLRSDWLGSFGAPTPNRPDFTMVRA